MDGWGWIIGDAGSAYWIGRNALEAALRGYDGRRSATVLTEIVAADFDDLELAYLELQADPDKVSRIASYAAKVDQVSGTDLVARNILDRAAAHLSEAVVSAAHKVGLGRGEPPYVCALGPDVQVPEAARPVPVVPDHGMADVRHSRAHRRWSGRRETAAHDWGKPAGVPSGPGEPELTCVRRPAADLSVAAGRASEKLLGTVPTVSNCPKRPSPAGTVPTVCRWVRRRSRRPESAPAR